MNDNAPSFLTLPNGDTLAYHKSEAKDNTKPGVMFLSGFKSDMEGTKALFLEELCQQWGIGYLRFDYSGHGQSSGDFLEGSIGRWKEDTLAAFDQLTEGPQVLIGSSMGGWLMLLTALARPECIKALLGVATAPDFTENLIWDVLKKEEQEIIMNEGLYNLPNEYCDGPDPEPYPITKLLIEEARNHLLLTQPSIPITCPVRLIHSMQDADVPYQLASELTEKLEGEDVEISLLKSGDHRMSTDAALSLLKRTLEELLSF